MQEKPDRPAYFQSYLVMNGWANSTPLMYLGGNKFVKQIHPPDQEWKGGRFRVKTNISEFRGINF